MELRHLLDISVDVLPPDLLGDFPQGERRLIRFSGGTFDGADGLSGVIADGGLDWQVVRPDGVIELAAHYWLRTDEGDAIEVRSDGIRVASAEVAARIASGAAVDPSEYYFRTFIRLGTSSARYDRLNRVLAVAWGERKQSTVHIHVHEVL
jgi:hypothetical protein